MGGGRKSKWGKWAMLALSLCIASSSISIHGAEECLGDQDGDLIVPEGHSCWLRPGTQTFRHIEIAGEVTVRTNLDAGVYAALEVWGDMTVTSGGLMSSAGQGYPAQQGAGAGVVKGAHGSGGG